ncbi:MAG: DUF2589 domain-containing protein [Chloroflexi bacterium]|nr:MAG: DUF2589 domain-containing protein [Chloroflexota bacterium]
MMNLTEFIFAIQQAVDQAAHMAAMKNLENFAESFLSRVANGASPDSSEEELYEPKSVTLIYPKETSQGIIEHQVITPLLSLAPISNLQLQEISLNVDLLILEGDDDLTIGFPKLTTAPHDGNTETIQPNAKMTIKLNATNHPDGLSAVIEGYDKSIRAQIPH